MLQMKRGRSYEQGCNIAYAMDVIGERWSCLLIRELLLGPKRFNELQSNLDGIGTNLLSTRLKVLTKYGILTKQKEAQSKRKSYVLTPLGRGLEPVLRELIRWGIQLPGSVRGSGDLHKREWDLVALRLLYRPEWADDMEGVFCLLSEGEELLVQVDHEGLRFEVDGEALPLATLEADRASLLQLFEGRSQMSQLIWDGKLTVTGDRALARQWASGFGC